MPHERAVQLQNTIDQLSMETGDQLLFLNITAPKLNLDSIPPSNLVFLIDISGSMDKPNRSAFVAIRF
jgi:Ca-activated chloride channel family protein